MAVSVSCVETGYSVARQGGQGKVNYGGLRYVPLWLGGQGEVLCVMVRLGAVGFGGSGELRPDKEGLVL